MFLSINDPKIWDLKAVLTFIYSLSYGSWQIFHSPLLYYAGEDLREGPGVVGHSSCHFLGVGDEESDVTKRQVSRQRGHNVVLFYLLKFLFNQFPGDRFCAVIVGSLGSDI